MKLKSVSLIPVLSVLALVLFAGCIHQGESRNNGADLSAIASLQKNGNALQLMVDNKPFIMISGELHNSSS